METYLDSQRLGDHRPTPPQTPESRCSAITHSSESTSLANLYSGGLEDAENCWVTFGWSKSYAQELIDDVLAWDFFPSCFICQEHFKQEYKGDSGEQCSRSLVAALLSLAMRLTGNRAGIARGHSFDYLAASDFLFEEATELLQRNRYSRNLADIQTLGALSLFHLRCGQEAQAQDLAEEFACAITNLCLTPCPASKGSGYKRARAVTYCGAISLNRYVLPTGWPICQNGTPQLADSL